VLNQRQRIPPTKVQSYPLRGGLDLVTPRLSLKPGFLIDAKNYEPLTVGGYRRINGYERFDGHTSPTTATYYTITANVTGAVAVSNTLTGATSGATGKVLAVSGSTIVLGRVTGTFVSGENLQVAAVTQAVATSAAVLSGASTAVLDATYRLLAADDRRADISTVPGSGQIRGIFVLADTVYAFRDNVAATSLDLYKATTGGWTKINYGFELFVVARSAAVTMTIAAPGVLTWNAHALANDQPIQLTTTGALPTGLTAGVTYYVRNKAANTFELAATAGGSSITTSGTQSGVHTATLVSSTGISVGDTVTGATSGASAVARAVLLRTGTWSSAPGGSIVFDSITGGPFQSGEALQVSSVTQAQASGASAQIARLPGGRVETVIGNFTGSSTTRKAYGADGVNCAFEFDGTRLIPIHTGNSPDTPSHIEVHKNKLFLAIVAALIYSTTNNPYAYTALTNAAELGMGDVITAILSLTGNAAGASLGVFTTGRTSILYGSSSADFQLVPSIYELGFLPFTVQSVSNSPYGLTARGVQSLTTTLNYGDFSFDALSINVQPLVQTSYPTACASVTLRGKNQYRLFFTDNTALVFGLTGEKLSGILTLDYGMPVRCCWNSVWTTGAEHTYFGSDDGYVYEDSVGTSFDGDEVEHWIRPAFNNLQSPRVMKRFRSCVFEAECEGYCEVAIGYDLGYANPDVEPPELQAAQALVGAGGYWDEQGIYWERVTWDAAVVNEPRISIDGTEKNIGFFIYGNSAKDDPITWQAANLLYTPRHVAR
jgi:hypothetical protein